MVDGLRDKKVENSDCISENHEIRLKTLKE